MAKGKNKAGGNNDNNNNNNNNGGEKNNNNNNDGEKNNNNNNGGGEYLNVVMKVDFHCNGCKQRIRKIIRCFPGVCAVELEGENTVKIIALKNMEFVKLRDKLSQKLVRNVELISPKPSNSDPKKDDKANDKPKELPVTTVTLKLSCYCEGCCKATHKALRSYKGVFEVLLNHEKKLVTVKGKVDGKKMVEDLKKKIKKTIEIVQEKNQKDKDEGEKKEGEKKQENNGGGAKGQKMVINQWVESGFMYEYGYRSMEMMPAPQMFSDENPNACSIM